MLAGEDYVRQIITLHYILLCQRSIYQCILDYIVSSTLLVANH